MICLGLDPLHPHHDLIFTMVTDAQECLLRVSRKVSVHFLEGYVLDSASLTQSFVFQILFELCAS